MSDTTAPKSCAASHSKALFRSSDNILVGVISGALFHAVHYGAMGMALNATSAGVSSAAIKVTSALGGTAGVLPLSIGFGVAAYGAWYGLEGRKTSVSNRLKAAAIQAGVGAVMYMGAGVMMPHENHTTSLTREAVEWSAASRGISMEEYLLEVVCLSEQSVTAFFEKWDRDPLTPGFQ